MQKKTSLIPFAVIMCLTLGLAPFAPEPHVIGKLKWILGGANGMQVIDYLDLLMHGTPWLFLIYAIIAHFMKRKGVKG